MGSEAPHLRSILRILRVDLFPPDTSMNIQSAYTVVQGGMVLWDLLYSVSAL